MAFVVEDGSGLSTATSYVSVADADAYATEVGLTAWTGTTGAKQTALIQAQRYMTQTLRGSWKGIKLTSTQALDWPRESVYDEDGYYVSSTSVPAAVKEAQVELAVRALSATLMPDVAAESAGIASESYNVGGVSSSVTYTGSKPTQTRYPKVWSILMPLLIGGNAVIRG